MNQLMVIQVTRGSTTVYVINQLTARFLLTLISPTHPSLSSLLYYITCHHVTPTKIESVVLCLLHF